MAEENDSFLHRIPYTGPFKDIADWLNANFHLIELAIKQNTGKSAYEVWRDYTDGQGNQPNIDGTEQEFLASLKESGYKMQAVTVRPSTIAGIEADKIYLYPDGSGQFSSAIYTGDLESSYDSTKWVVLATNPNDLSGAFTDISGLRTDVNNLSTLVGYFTCDTAAATAAKTVQATGYELTNGGNIRIKMTHANTATSGVTLQIGSAVAQTLYYNGEEVSDENTWEDNETIVVYYDGVSYYSTNSLGGGEGLKKAGIIVNKETGTNLLNPGEKEVGGIVGADGSVDSTQTDRYTSDFIPIEPETAYTLYGSSGSAHNVTTVCLYYSNKSKKLVRTNRNYITATESEDAAYIRITDTFAGQVGIFKGENIPYTPYINTSHTEYGSSNSMEQKTEDEILVKGDVTPIIADVEEVKNKLDGVDEENFKGLAKSLEYSEEKSTNLVDPDSFVKGIVNNTGSVDIDDTSNWRTSDFIRIDTSKSYTLYDTGGDSSMRYIAFFRDDKTGISGTKTGDVASLTPSDYPTGAAYIRCSSTNLPMGVFEGVDTPYEDYYYNENIEYHGNDYGKKSDYELLTKKDVDAGLEYVNKVSAIAQYKEEVSSNLLNPANQTQGLIDNSGNVSTAGAGANYVSSDFIPVDANTTYTFVGLRGIAFYNGNNFIVKYQNSVEGTFQYTSPAGAIFVRVYGSSLSGGIFKTSSYSQEDYEPYYHRRWIDYKGNSDDDTSNIVLNKSGANITISGSGVVIRSTFDKTPDDIYGSSHCFNFLGASWAGISHGNYDDVPALHLRGTDVAANHNYPQYKVTINNHNLTNSDIGGVMASASGGYEHVIMRIVDENNIILVNRQTSDDDYITVHAPISPLTYNGNSYTVDSSQSSWLFPSLKNITQKIVIDGKVQDGDITDGEGNVIDIVESYDLMDVKDVQANLTSDGIYNGRAIVHIDSINRFCDDMTVLVFCNLVFPAINGRFVNFGFSMAANIAPSNLSSIKYYVPASDDKFATPTNFNLTASADFTPVTGKTISRAIEIYNDAIFVLGILPVGVGANLSEYTTVPLEISNTGKLYPHPVDKRHLNSNGASTTVGEAYSAVMYRKYLKASDQKQGRICMYRINHDGVAYIYIDYAVSMFDHVELNDASLNGKTIEVVEQMNSELKTTIYNGGFFILTDFAAGQSCYCIVKIKL